MDFIFYIFIFLFGLIIGSFLNVVIFRLETGETVVHGRSHCRHCEHFLEWYDLVPVISFFALGGKCRYCKKSLSVQYPIVEIATALLFVLAIRILNFEFVSDFGFRISDFLATFYFLFIISALIVIFAYDFKHYIIPDKIVYSAIVVSSIYRFSDVLKFVNLGLSENLKFKIENLALVFNPFFAAFLAGSFFLAIVIITKGKGMGGGDIKLAFLMGLALGWPKILLALFLAFTAGAVYGIILMIMRRKTLKSEIPFGPFLVAGTIFAMFWGEKIVKWYGGYLF